MKTRCRFRSCCFGIGLDDGVHGIVVWDSLYALFVITTTMSILVAQVEHGQMNKSLTDLITSVFLAIRAGVGISTCCHKFSLDRVRNYLIVRLSWDIALVIFNIIMIALRNMQMQSFLTKLVVLILVDGYLNLIIISYLTQNSISREEDSQNSSMEDEDIEQASDNPNFLQRGGLPATGMQDPQGQELDSHQYKRSAKASMMLE